MSGTAVAGDSNTTDGSGNSEGWMSDKLALAFGFLILLIILSVVSYKCKRNVRSSPPPNDHHTVPQGVEDEVIVTFPAFVYTEQMMGDSAGSDCSICLADYKTADVVRLLPECGHLFHCKCIDTWLKLHATCPVCRKSPSPVKASTQRS